ncbi:FxsA family protein [Aliikangiella coralliicola]|uniref:FxsA family protein n=1 Tax=Aliikangiella coralliicola TaxID=2592383 RepID=UPI00143DE51B|nr:FxsA family protein [Aliikangiella coralliicola]
MQLLLLLFILVPIIEIGVFIQVGDILGLGTTLFIVVITAVVGVNLLKRQGFKAWRDIQMSMAQGQIPALEMASAAQLLFAGGLLLTPGFVTDFIGFSLMIPEVRRTIAKQLMRRWQNKASGFSQSSHFHDGSEFNSYDNHSSAQRRQGRTLEGEYEERSE